MFILTQTWTRRKAFVCVRGGESQCGPQPTGPLLPPWTLENQDIEWKEVGKDLLLEGLFHT